jgi:hypothetical protein
MASASTTTCLHISLYFHDQFSLCEVSLGLRGALTPPQVLGSCCPYVREDKSKPRASFRA